ncbi:MAG: ester cyclase [Candidatus Heimdallarchaeota archaeon]|nr:ester cyclase [Candidatus Heimdallarchaeota archaeon]
MNSKIKNENINTVEKLLKSFESLDENHDFEVFREFIHPDFYISKRRIATRQSQQRSSDQLSIQIGLDDTDQELIGVDMYIETLRLEERLSELKIEIFRIMSSQNTVWADMDISGIHDKTIFGIPPTNQFIKYRAVFFYEFREGKIITSDGLYDHLTFLSYIGRAVLTEPQSEKTQLYLKYLHEKGLISDPTSV